MMADFDLQSVLQTLANIGPVGGQVGAAPATAGPPGVQGWMNLIKASGPMGGQPPIAGQYRVMPDASPQPMTPAPASPPNPAALQGPSPRPHMNAADAALIFLSGGGLRGLAGAYLAQRQGDREQKRQLAGLQLLTQGQGSLAERAALAHQYGLPDSQINDYLRGSELDQPTLENVNGMLLDKHDKANAGKYVPQLDKGQEPLFDSQGNIAGVRTLDGEIRSVGEITRAQEDAKNASAASYAEATAGAKARGELPYVGPHAAAEAGAKAPFDFETVTGPNGQPMTVSKAYLAGRESGSGPIVGQSPADAQYGKNLADAAAESYKGIQTAGQGAAAKIAKLQQLDTLLSGFEGNRFSPTGLELARVGNSIWGGLSPKMSNAEAAQALSNQMALELRNPQNGAGMPGALSDSDRNFLAQSVPGLVQSTGGRHKLVTMQVAISQRDADVAQKARLWQQRFGRIDAPDAHGKGFQDYLTVWASQNPLFGK